MANEKAVLISIQPKWCKLIASGQKTVEVRKTKPKLKAPFKCYIYETKTPLRWNKSHNGIIGGEGGKVIGEFVCGRIFDICIEISNPGDFPGYPFPCTGLTDVEILQYLGNGKTGYGWSISNLVIYDKPKPLSKFNHCGVNYHFNPTVTRPPQSWCYVEEHYE